MNLFVDSSIAAGQRSAWALQKKLGEGDAGEVFLVEELVTKRAAILKRPRKSSFAHEIHRQAEQIRTEGRILKALQSLLKELPGGPLTPDLLDQSKSGTDFGERYFIVIDQAKGFDLNFYTRVCRMGLPENELASLGTEERLFLQEMAQQGRIPRRILLACLSAILKLFDKIHFTPVETGSQTASGILWNDVKPDHLFWDPRLAFVTIIDWGNGKFLEEDGSTRDMRHTAEDDLRQFIDEMGRFLEQSDPDLKQSLIWPKEMPQPNAVDEICNGLRERIDSALSIEAVNLAETRRQETGLFTSTPDIDQNLILMEEVQRRILNFGEYPDYASALRLAGDSASLLAGSGNFESLLHLCNWVVRLPGASPESWQLLANLSHLAAIHQGEARRFQVEAIQSAASSDWEGVLWNLLASLQAESEPDWWNELLDEVRCRRLVKEDGLQRPLLSLRRLALTLQTYNQQMEDQQARTPGREGDAERLAAPQNLLERMREVISNWVQIEPLPPHCTLLYSDIDPLIDEIDSALPGAGAQLARALEQPRIQVKAVLEAWNRKEFSTATRGLRSLLMVDPDRRRLLRAERALQATPDWLLRVHMGPTDDATLQEYVTGLEFEGRELRNQIGPAGWMDGILDGMKHLRRGTWPADLLEERPALLGEMPWLQKYERNEKISRLLRPTLNLPLPGLPAFNGSLEGRCGPEGDVSFLEPMDAWVPEARGSSARVYRASFRANNGERHEAALKILRIDRPDYGLPLFREEVQILSLMQDIPGVNRMLECGFIFLNNEGRLPMDNDLQGIRELRGDLLRLGLDSTGQFITELEKRTRDGWTPYILLDQRRREDSLLLMCDASFNRGRFLPVSNLLLMCVQICDILQIAHERKIVYRDHKLLHYYWVPEENGIYMIDWNVARYHPNGLRDFDIHMDLVQLAARGLHHILTGRPAPGALPLGPTRPEEIEQAAESYRAQWTFDDQRLSPEIRATLEQALSGAYTSATALKDDLKRAAVMLE